MHVLLHVQESKKYFLITNDEFMENQVSARPLPFFYVGKSITRERVNNYEAQKRVLLTQAIGKDDTKNVWYSKEHVVKLLDEINAANGDGLLISFGMYEDAHQFAKQTCLMMNITRANDGDPTRHTVINLENEPDFADRSAQPKDVILFPGDNGIFSKVKDFNFGSPCPPRCSAFDDLP